MKKIIIVTLALLVSQIAFAGTKVTFETNRGNFTVELFDKQAPETVKNFLKYVDSGFYNDTIFHRVIESLLIQGGGFTQELARKETRDPIKSEASEDLQNLRGTIAMARQSSPHSATSQFFINLKDNQQFDWRQWNLGYTVFGKVVSGMTTIDSISYSLTGDSGIHKDVPVEAIVIFKVYRSK